MTITSVGVSTFSSSTILRNEDQQELHVIDWAEVLVELRRVSSVVTKEEEKSIDTSSRGSSILREGTHDNGIKISQERIDHDSIIQQNNNNILYIFRLYKIDFVQQLKQYLDTIIQYYRRRQQQQSQEQNPYQNESTVDVKNLIIQTRNALRFGLNCFSKSIMFNDNKEISSSESISILSIIQNEACDIEWHTILVHIISYPYGDNKCRLYSARILCNIITCNIQTCTILITKTIQHLIPSNHIIKHRMLHNEEDSNDNDTNIHNNNYVDDSIINWLDLILNCTRSNQRDTMGAIVACLHNVICVLEDSKNNSNDIIDNNISNDDYVSTIEQDNIDKEVVTTNTLSHHTNDVPETIQQQMTIDKHNIPIINNDNNNNNSCSVIIDSFVRNVASCSLLISTCLRQVIDSKSIIQQQKQLNDNNSDDISIIKESGNLNMLCHDEGTEWILLLINKLCCIGYFPIMYQCIGNNNQQTNVVNSNDKIKKIQHNNDKILPEQFILLYHLQHQLETNPNTPLVIDTTEIHNNNKKMDNNLDDFCTDKIQHRKIIESYLFLCNLYIQLSHNHNSISDSEQCNVLNNDDHDDEYDHSLREQANDIILEIIASTMASNDSSMIKILRSFIGKETKLISVLLHQLSDTIDRIEKEQKQKEIMYNKLNNNNKQYSKSRESKISICDQRFCTVAIRILGSLCYQNEYNQDLIRLTVIKEPPAPPPSIMPPDNTITMQQPEQKDDHDRNNNQIRNGIQRNGIYVMLSTTSLSHSCFTLREWSVIAIRYLLDNNQLNQHVVDELETKEAIQSAVLHDIGLQVDMNKNTGKVSIKKIEMND